MTQYLSLTFSIKEALILSDSQWKYQTRIDKNRWTGIRPDYQNSSWWWISFFFLFLEPAIRQNLNSSRCIKRSGLCVQVQLRGEVRLAPALP